jgi:PPOX class probable F420-dependent enzyme
VDEHEARRRVTAAPIGRLATVRPDGSPHLVPVCFAVDGDSIVTVIDSKPKSTRRLARLANVRADPRVSLLVDHYGDDWSEIWWVRVDGAADVVEDGAALADAVSLLAEKYEQYKESPPAGPAIVIAAQRWTWWEGS